MLLVNGICEHLSKRINSGELTNENLVQILEHVGRYLNLQTISDYAKENKLSYNGTKRFRTVKVIFGVKFIIDND